MSEVRAVSSRASCPDAEIRVRVFGARGGVFYIVIYPNFYLIHTYLASRVALTVSRMDLTNSFANLKRML